jgi:hypothetical protein
LKLDHTGGKSSKNGVEKGVKGRGKEVERGKKKGVSKDLETSVESL